MSSWSVFYASLSSILCSEDLLMMRFVGAILNLYIHSLKYRINLNPGQGEIIIHNLI